MGILNDTQIMRQNTAQQFAELQGQTGIMGLSSLGQTGIMGLSSLGQTGIMGLSSIQSQTGIMGLSSIQSQTGITKSLSSIQGPVGDMYIIQGVTYIRRDSLLFQNQQIFGIQGQNGIMDSKLGARKLTL
jgi:hypothetical protein